METQNIIVLNVSGEKRELSSETLKKLPVFEQILETSNTNELFIDRDPDLFDQVISYVVWNIIPTEQEAIYEIDHYGILMDDEMTNYNNGKNNGKKEMVEKLTTTLAEQILSDTNIPYYISACGKIFVTTKERLSNIGYFRGVFNELLKPLYKGTSENPYRCEIPWKNFDNILKHLRDNRIQISESSMKIIEILGGISSHQKTTSPPISQIAPSKYAPNTIKNVASGFYCELASESKSFLDKPTTTIWRRAFQKTTRFSINRVTVFASNYDLYKHEYLIGKQNIADVICQCYCKLNTKDITTDITKKYQIIDKISFEINCQKIQVFDGYQLKMLSKMKDKSLSELPIIHIPFFFCDSGRALPVNSLPYSELKIIIITKVPQEKSPELLLTWGCLTNEERHSYINSKCLEYIIPMYYTPNLYINYTNEIRCDLGFYHCTRAIFFTLHFTEEDIEPIKDGYIGHQLLLNGHLRHQADSETCILDRIDHNFNIDESLYVIPFAKDIQDEYQSTAILDMSQVTVTLNVKVSPKVKVIRVWGNYWNRFMIESGRGGAVYL